MSSTTIGSGFIRNIDGDRRYLVVDISGNKYAIVMNCVTGIHQPENIIEIPEMPDYTIGAFSYLGKPIVLVDISEMLKLEKRSVGIKPYSIILSFKMPDGEMAECAMKVDRPLDFKTINERDIVKIDSEGSIYGVYKNIEKNSNFDTESNKVIEENSNINSDISTQNSRSSLLNDDIISIIDMNHVTNIFSNNIKVRK